MYIDYSKAKLRLDLIYQIASSGMTPVCNYSEFLDLVINSKTKTYKYMLFTALLAKNIEQRINPLCLQSNADCDGSYCPRILCDKVVLPFEKEKLNNALGGSSSPFTNNPATRPMIDRNTPTRGKEARKILNGLCDVLPEISSSAEALECLIYIVYQLIQKKNKEAKISEINISQSEDSLFRLLNFINAASQRSIHGETLTLLTAGIYYLLYQNKAKVVIHNVNQCGTSSRQISDLDIFNKQKKQKCILCNELKDKKYSEFDVRFAADKVIDSGLNKMYFIEGYYGEPIDDFKRQLEMEYMQKGFLLKIISISDFAFNTLNTIDNIDINKFLQFIIQEGRNNCFSDEVIEWLLDCAEIHFNKNEEIVVLQNTYTPTQHSHWMN